MDKNLALETLKSFVENTDNIIAKDAILALHPELAESEDERIRKAIVELVEWVKEQQVHTDRFNGGITWNQMLAYLEKQKEQKPSDKLALENPLTGEKVYEREIPECVKGADPKDVEAIVHLAAKGWTVIAPGKEQNHAEWSDSVAKEMFIKALERAVEQTKKGYELTDCDKHSWWEDFKAYSGINPAEWSEKDEKFFKTALWHISYSVSNGRSTDDHCDTTDWLKGVKERLKSLRPQPKQEWSEEDENNRLAIGKAIREYIGKDGLTQGEASMLIQWLKSLRPKPHWKPSEEQIGALERAIVKMHTSDDIGILAELRDILKKL